MSAVAHTNTPSVGERVELARYTVADQHRVIYGQRIEGVVRLTDRPAEGPGRAYLIERELEHDGHAALQALLADYLDQARHLQAVPMSTSLLAHHLNTLSDDAKPIGS